jgi:hypothetical protein
VRKADIIILFPVPELEAVNREAEQLIKDGYADYLCIPTSLSLYRVDDKRNCLTSVQMQQARPGLIAHHPRSRQDISLTYFQEIRRVYHFPRFFENTHVEMLLAKQVMDAYGFKRAVFVSSPYHMRRIQIIAGSVFGPSYTITLVPSRFMRRYDSFVPSLNDMQNVFMEIGKMSWFLCYDFWPVGA